MELLPFFEETPKSFSEARRIEGADASAPLDLPTGLLTRIANHLHVRDGHMSVLRVAFLHAGVFGRFLGVFFQVVHCCIRDNAAGDYGMADMFSQSRFVAAPEPPKRYRLFAVSRNSLALSPFDRQPVTSRTLLFLVCASADR